MKLTMVGTGYVGLVTGVCFANTGNDVTCLDVDPRKIEKLKKGVCPIYEPGLEEMMAHNDKAGRLHYTLDKKAAYRDAEMIFICVGTPTGEHGQTDLKYVFAAADDIADMLKELGPSQKTKVVVMKSTVPVGTTMAVRDRIRARVGPSIPFKVADNPEFLKEGAAIDDFMKPDRVVVGIEDESVGEAFKRLYDPFVRNGHPIYLMDVPSAEMVKYCANNFLATKISFINEMANLCEKLHADVNDVRRGIGHDQRIGFQFLHPGPGYGGSCFPKDVNALIYLAKSLGVTVDLMDAVDRVNIAQKAVLPTKVKLHFGNELKGKTLAIWGIAFKPGTDDIREAPALTLIDQMLAEGVHLRVHDPEAIGNLKQIYGDKLTYCDRPYGALEGADGLAVVTEWQAFRRPDFDVIKKLLRTPVIFDGRNIYEPKAMKELGFTYYGIGR